MRGTGKAARTTFFVALVAMQAMATTLADDDGTAATTVMSVTEGGFPSGWSTQSSAALLNQQVTVYVGLSTLYRQNALSPSLSNFLSLSTHSL